MKKLILFMLAFVLVFSCAAVPASADFSKEDAYEIALLIDVSGSMNQADPKRISIEAAKAFAYYYPSQAEYFKISVILYNTDVIAAVNGVDVTTEEGMETYQQSLDTIGKLGRNGRFNDFVCWAKDTDIGEAIVEAEKILSASNAGKKAVLLFTDGKIDLDNSFEVTTPEEQASRDNSFACAQKFHDAGIPMYTVGLNYNNGVDREFMQQLADMTDGKFAECTSADQLVSFFQDVYANLTRSTFNPAPPIVIQPNVESKHSVNIYGQAISEANLVLFSSAVIDTFTVTNPNGVVIAQGKADGSVSAADDCIINRNNLTINVKLINPTDGYWTISFMSATSGTVQIGEIYLYNLNVANDSDDTITVGNSVVFQPVLFNADTNSRITTQAIYESSTCTVAVNGNGVNAVYNAPLNEAKNGYKLPLPFDMPGEYNVTYKITNEQFEVETSGKLYVLPPKLELTTDVTTCERGEKVTILGTLSDPLTGEAMELPGYLADAQFTADVTCGDNTASVTGTYQNDGSIMFTYYPTEAGDCEVSATVSRYNDVVTSTNTVKFTVWMPELTLETEKTEFELGGALGAALKLRNPITSQEIPLSKYLAGAELEAEIKLNGQVVATLPVNVDGDNISINYQPTEVGVYTITVTGGEFVSQEMTFTAGASTITGKEELADVSESVLFGDVVKEIDLNAIFSDSDGDKLTYKASVDGAKMDVSVSGGILTLTAKGGAEGTVTVTVSDGRGAEYTETFTVKVASMMPLFITIIVLVVLAAVGTPITLIVLNKRRIIRMRYRIKVTLDTDTDQKSAVYDISRASSNRRAKPVMTVKEILSLTTLASCVYTGMTDAEMADLLNEYGSRISVTGFAFKDGIKITEVDGKTRIFTKAVANVMLKSKKQDDNTTVMVSFGKTTDFAT